jgi:hypothetical protein
MVVRFKFKQGGPVIGLCHRGFGPGHELLYKIAWASGQRVQCPLRICQIGGLNTPLVSLLPPSKI